MDGSVEGAALVGVRVPSLKGGPFKGVLEAGADLTEPHILPDPTSSNARSRSRSPPPPLPWFTRSLPKSTWSGSPFLECLAPLGLGDIAPEHVVLSSPKQRLLLSPKTDAGAFHSTWPLLFVFS